MLRCNPTRVLTLVLLSVCCNPWVNAAEKNPFELQQDDVVVFLGGTNMLRLQQSGHLESLLTHAFAEHKPRFRDLSWEADDVFALGTVIERWRPDGFGDRNEQFRRVGTTVAIAQFGAMESFRGQEGLADFVASYEALLNDLREQARLIVLVSPIRFESSNNPHTPNLRQRNQDLAAYVAAIGELAKRRDLVFVDLFNSSLDNLTRNGMHVTPEAQPRLAQEIAGQLGCATADPEFLEPLRAAVREKHRLWYDYWRPANWKLLYGDDSQRQFTRGGNDYIPFREEWKRLLPLIEKAEERVWLVAAGQPDPGAARPAPETLHGDPSADVAEELQAFTVSDDLQVNLFASEEHGLTSPLAIRWDPAGKMYVTVTTTYPHVFPGDLPNDKIITLEDRDGDGVADHPKVFAEGLNIPTGLEWGDGGVYVGQNTELLFLQDTDGDGIADERRVMLSGFGNGDSHQTINSFIWSPGGELFFGQGDGCESRVETPWGASNLYQAGFYRLRPQRLQLHPLLDDFMGPGNPWGVAFDDWGQIFSIDGAGGVTFLSPGQVPTSHRLRIGMIGEPGGYCGIGYLDAQNLPESLRGHFVIGDYKANRVKRFSVDRQGAGFKLNWEEPLLTSKHRNFRPVDVKIGPDGAIYVVDWYNPITCHQDDAYRDPTRDKAHGRIWRISSRQSPIEPPDLTKAPLTQVLDALQSPDHWTRYQAKRALTIRNATEVAKAMDTWVRNLNITSPAYEHHLYEALGAYATLEIIRPELLIKLLNADEPRARAYASRIVGRWHDRLEDPLDLLQPRVVDEDPLVRMEAVIACAAIPTANSMPIAAQAVDKPMDDALTYAFRQAVHHLRPHWLPAFRTGTLTFEKPQHLARVINEIGDRDVLDDLRQLARTSTVSADIRSSAITGILSVGNEEDLHEFALAATHFQQEGKHDARLHAHALTELAKASRHRELRPAGDHVALLRNLAQHSDPTIQVESLRLIGLWQTQPLLKEVFSLAQDESRPRLVRAAAFDALADLDDPKAMKLLEGYSRDLEPPELRSAAVQALAKVSIQDASQLAVTLLREEPLSQAATQQLLATILDRRNGGESLATAFSSHPLDANHAQNLLRALFATGRSNTTLFQVLNDQAGAANTVPEYDEAFVAKLVAESHRAGNSTRGQTVFKNMACLSCHRVGREGGAIGPDLTSIGTTLATERIVEELLWPNRQVKEGFAALQVFTDDGRILQGYERRTKSSRDDGDLMIKELSTGELLSIKRDQIDEIVEAGSAMPTGLTAVLTPEQLADLIRYLSDLGKIQ